MTLNKKSHCAPLFRTLEYGIRYAKWEKKKKDLYCKFFQYTSSEMGAHGPLFLRQTWLFYVLLQVSSLALDNLIHYIVSDFKKATRPVN